jgi:hypothetical protein
MGTPARSSFDPTRRRLLVAGAGALVLAACGGGEGGRTDAAGPAGTTGDGAAGATTSTAAGAGALSLLRVFAPEQAVGVPLRLPLAFADADGVPTDAVPDRIAVRAVSPSGVEAPPVTIERRGEGIPSPYFPFEATFDEPGAWRLGIAVGAATTATEVTLRPAQELAVVPGPGDRLPSIPTPTTADPLGVDPLCTAVPPCPLHATSLADALGTATPVALLVSTPAFCQTAICGPVLDLLVERSTALSDRVTFLHVEVYTDDTGRRDEPDGRRPRPAPRAEPLPGRRRRHGAPPARLHLRRHRARRRPRRLLAPA